MKGLLHVGVALIALTAARGVEAADLRKTMPVKAARKVPAYDWTGFYLGAHVGNAWGSSGWTANGIGTVIPPLSGSLDFFQAYDAFKGTGSFFGGLQAGYNYMMPSRWVLGIEADVSAPNSILGSQTISSAASGQASYSEKVELSGTVRGRVGYAPSNSPLPGNWLFYVTGGLAWSYDQFTRTQLDGTPLGGTAVPGTVETPIFWRTGWAAGAGAEVALPSNWTARAEFLFTGFGSHAIMFPVAAEQFNADLNVQSIRLGLNYRIGGSGAATDEFFSKGPTALETANFAVHGQTTYTNQYTFPFRAPYSGAQSFIPNIGRETWDATFYIGFRPWEGGEIWINPEIDQGFGVSNTFGVAGYVSAEAYKLGANFPYTRLDRMFLRQTIDLGGESQKVDAGINQFSGAQTADRLVLTIGKFSIPDVFDTNKYAHDGRNDFMNWALVDTGTFDYASDAWGYTYGAAAEWYKGDWTVRGGIFDLTAVPGSTDLDPQFGQFQWVGEIERRYALWQHPGKIAVTGFLTRGRTGSYNDAVQLAMLTGTPANAFSVAKYGTRSGIGLNLEQQITDDLGMFARAGLADGNLEPYDTTDIDRTVAVGFSLAGKSWNRSDDTVGVAGIVNGISSAHQAYFNAGGLGIVIGDGMLPHPGLEDIIEAYYSLPVSFWKLTFDYQFIVNPAYNTDRGPVSVIGARLHTQF